MKNSLLLASLLISSVVFAQTKSSFGLRAGITNAGIKGDAANSLQNLIGFANGAITTASTTGIFGGAYASIPLANQLSFEPAVYYSQKGYELKGELSIKGADFLSAGARAQLSTAYIDMPLLVKATISGFQVFAGPQVSYLANARLRTTAGALGFNIVDNTMDARSQFNQWDMALTGGVGYQFVNGINISAAYDHGLSKVDANKNFDAYNRAIKVGIGFRF